MLAQPEQTMDEAPFDRGLVKSKTQDKSDKSWMGDEVDHMGVWDHDVMPPEVASDADMSNGVLELETHRMRLFLL